MTKRENRIINAFINCVKRNEYTFEYACILIEDSSKYGFLTEEAKEQFYAEFEVEEVEEIENMEEEDNGVSSNNNNSIDNNMAEQ